MTITKCVLQRIQFAGWTSEGLYGLDVMSICLNSEHDARPNWLAIEQDCARAADAVLASDVRAGQSEILSDKVAEQQTRLDLALVLYAVDVHVKCNATAHDNADVGYCRSLPFMKLRRQIATFLAFLGEAIGGRPSTSAPSVEPNVPPAMERAVWLESKHEIAIRELLENCARSLVPRNKHVRANMMTFTPDRTRRKVHAATAYNMAQDPDRDLEIGATAAASGKAVTARRAAVADLGLLQITNAPAWGLLAEEQARVRPTLKSILAVPIFNPEDIDGPLLGSLQVDSDLTVEEAGFTRPESAELLQQFADLLSLLLVGVHVRVGGVKVETVKLTPKSRVQNAQQVEPGLYVANRSTSIFQLSKNYS